MKKIINLDNNKHKYTNKWKIIKHLGLHLKTLWLFITFHESPSLQQKIIYHVQLFFSNNLNF